MSFWQSLADDNKHVRQSEGGECGLACLTMIARHYGDKRDLASWRRQYPLSTRGTSLKDMVSIADEMGFHTRPLKSDLASLKDVALPAILHWNLNHYVVLDNIQRAVGGLRYKIFDPAGGISLLKTADMSGQFTGIVLELMPTASFKPILKSERLHLSQLWTRIKGITPALARILILSVIMQVVVLVVPFYTQLAIDTALPGSDLDLLNILAIGFAGILLLNAAAAWARSRLVLSLGNSLGMQTAVNLFRHTIHLPTAWFEKRHLGDVTSRFGSLQPITDLLTRGLVSSIVDGFLAVATLCLMVIFSPLLASLTVFIILIYAALKLASFQAMKFANANVLTAQAIESSIFIENIRGISAIKVFCQEGNRQRQWQNRKADVINGSIKLGRLTGNFDALNAFLIGIENLIFIYVSIKMVLGGSLTIGMIFALQAYKQSFIGSTSRLIDQIVNFRLLDVHLSRISDIALEEQEVQDKYAGHGEIGTIELKDVSFSYGFGQPAVLRNVSLRIVPGETTALIGPSGAGKTTLFKILCGLLQPTSGQLLVDGTPISEYGARAYRQQLGVVSQEDTLFAGSLAENIAFFDPDYNLGDVATCCRLAAIHEDIEGMPLKYQTPVGDMGSNLSGGQKQRILLARALYSKPTVLMMDEGTAHLDVATERRVLAALKNIGGTRILVAHRPDTIKLADTVYKVVDGTAVLTQIAHREGGEAPQSTAHLVNGNADLSDKSA